MNAQHITRIISALKSRRRQAGFSLIEGMVSIAVVTVIAGVVIPAVYNEYEKAKLANCMSELNGMRAVAFDLGNGRYIPTVEEFWGEGYPDAAPGEYYYLVDNQDHNKGHGNDLDNCDEDNPGSSIDGRDCQDVKFVVLCNHKHGSHAKYCYATDSLSPTAVPVDATTPDYQKWLTVTYDDGKPKEGKEPRTKKTK
jgi:prepilin-type N-terminal cleavage/methylation domain-containing protein